MSGILRKLRRDQERAMQKLRATTPRDQQVAICTPCDDHVATPYMTSLVQMLMYTWSHQPAGLAGIQLCNYGSSLLTFSRYAIASAALRGGATHLLWIDSDMEFQPDTLTRLLSHGKAIVAANCMARRPPFRSTARLDGEDVPTTMQSTGLQRVDKVGFGVTMIAAEVFRALPPPWFHFEWIENPNENLRDEQPFLVRGEDFALFEAATRAGFEVWIDHDVSKGVRHVGAFGYSPVLKGIAAAHGMAPARAADLSSMASPLPRAAQVGGPA